MRRRRDRAAEVTFLESAPGICLSPGMVRRSGSLLCRPCRSRPTTGSDPSVGLEAPGAESPIAADPVPTLIGLTPMRFQPITRPLVVQVIETEPATQLRSQPKGMFEQLPRVQVLEPWPTATKFFGPRFFGERLAGGQVLSGPTASGLWEIRLREFGLARGGTLQVLGKLALDRDDEFSAAGYGHVKMRWSAS